MQSNDVNIKGIAIFFGILAVTLTIAYGVITAMWRAWENNARVADEQSLLHASAPDGRPYFPYPREQPNPLADLTALRAREEAEINSYGWINKTAGVVRIPIDRAMDLLSPPSEKHP